MVATYGFSGLKMNMLFGVTVLTGFVSSASSFSDLQVSGSLLLTGEGQGKKKVKSYHIFPTRIVWEDGVKKMVLIWKISSENRLSLLAASQISELWGLTRR